MSKHYVVDIETLDTRPTAAIIGIAIVGEGYEFDIKCHPHHYTLGMMLGNPHITVGKSTLEFWKSQAIESPEAYKKYWLEVSPEDYRPEEMITKARNEFHKLVNSVEPDSHFWSRGKDFDFPILVNAFSSQGLQTPWGYRNTHCLRDMEMLLPEYKLSNTGYVKHDALQDAYYEQKLLDSFMTAGLIPY